jgi:hypothetical protein
MRQKRKKKSQENDNKLKRKRVDGRGDNKKDGGVCRQNLSKRQDTMEPQLIFWRMRCPPNF